MFFKSIRWQLQLWHALLLVLVLAGFGFTACQLQRSNQLNRIDQDLQHRISIIASIIRNQLGPRDGLGPPGPGPGRFPGEDGVGPRPDHPPPGRLPPDRRPPPEFRDREDLSDRREPPPTRGLRLSSQDLNLFAGPTNTAFYFVAWTRDGRLLEHSESASGDIPRPARTDQVHSVRMRGTLRELSHYNPHGDCILAGRDIAPELADMRRFALLLFGAGGAVLILGLAGGWLLSARAIRPIKDISATAAKIATGDLSQRIPAADAENELGQLASVLNSTFARLESSFAHQARFTADAAHELRTPISVMLTQTQGALTRERTAPEYRETVEACQRAAQRMRGLIESLLALARLDAGQEAFKRERLDLARTAAECLELVRPLAAERQIRLHTNLTPVFCLGDNDRLAQVVTNLLTNAIHYNKAGGEVRLSSEQNNGSVMLNVSDTGEGIGPEDLPHVFERFWRADKSRARSTGRTGLGLAIAKSIVETHGGTLEVSSVPGEGSTFTLRLTSAPETNKLEG